MMGKIGLVCLWFLFAVMIVILAIVFIWGEWIQQALRLCDLTSQPFSATI